MSQHLFFESLGISTRVSVRQLLEITQHHIAEPYLRLEQIPAHPAWVAIVFLTQVNGLGKRNCHILGYRTLHGGGQLGRNWHLKCNVIKMSPFQVRRFHRI